MSALRDTEGKLNWVLLFEHFPLALKELCRAREFGARHYTKDGKDGATNWRESINGPEHDKFYKGCIRGAMNHKFEALWGENRVTKQDNIHHLAFGALNDLMALEYALAKERKQEQQREIDLSSLQMVEYGNETCNRLTGEPKKTIYDWSKIDKKYKWVAMDACGPINAFDTKPILHNSCSWWPTSGTIYFTLQDVLLSNDVGYRNSLEARPMTLDRIGELNGSI